PASGWSCPRNRSPTTAARRARQAESIWRSIASAYLAHPRRRRPATIAALKPRQFRHAVGEIDLRAPAELAAQARGIGGDVAHVAEPIVPSHHGRRTVQRARQRRRHL